MTYGTHVCGYTISKATHFRCQWCKLLHVWKNTVCATRDIQSHSHSSSKTLIACLSLFLGPFSSLIIACILYIMDNNSLTYSRGGWDFLISTSPSLFNPILFVRDIVDVNLRDRWWVGKVS